MNKLVNIIPKFLSEINNFSRREVESFAYLSIEKILGYSKSECIIHSNQELTNDNIISFENIISDLKQNIPIQYILGEAHFYDLKFKVNSSTLIPRELIISLIETICFSVKSCTLFSVFIFAFSQIIIAVDKPIPWI